MKDLAFCPASLLCAGLILISMAGGVQASCRVLFTFGDSYMDSGNRPASNYSSSGVSPWNSPYGTTYPGQPSGRWCDGRVFPEALARALKLKLPATYRTLPTSRKSIRTVAATRGITFARASSTAATDPATPYLSIQIQIDQFEALLKSGAIKMSTLKRAITLVSIGGNDYINNKFNPTAIPAVTDAIAAAVQRLYGLGLRTVLVTTLPNPGCIPLSRARFAAANVTVECIKSNTSLSSFHNAFLKGKTDAIQVALPGLKVITIDLGQALLEVVNSPAKYGFPNPGLLPACNSLPIPGSFCGIVFNNTALYTLSPTGPSKFVFWDTLHPTQQAYKTLARLIVQQPGYTSPGPNLWAALGH